MFYYLATPYAKYPTGHEQAFIAACRQAALLVRSGIPVFCPIAHSHPISHYGHIDPNSHDIWLPADQPMIDAAKGLIICKLPSWESSYGIRYEHSQFHAAGKPIIYMDPDVVPVTVLRREAEAKGVAR